MYACIKTLCYNVLMNSWAIREVKHSNLNMRHLRLTSKGIAFSLGHTVEMSILLMCNGMFY